VTTARWILLGVGLAIALTPTASAHALLLDAQPAASSHRDAPPDVVLLRFTEDVEHEYTHGEVYDLNGTRVDGGRTIFDDQRHDQILVPLKPIRDGVYTVKWYSLSVDTHTASGSYLFAVGNASLQGNEQATQGHHHAGGWISKGLESFARGLFYVGTAATLGFAAFHLFVAGPVVIGWPDARGVRPGGRVGAIVGGLGVLGGFVVLLAFAQRIGLPSAQATGTHIGRFLAARVAGLLLATAALAVGSTTGVAPKRARFALMVALVGDAAAILATTLSSHAAALSSNRIAAIMADALHVVAGSVWAGGLFALLFTVPGQEPLRLAHIVRRFSPVAVGCVVFILATGTFAAFLHLHHVGDLVVGNYGLALTFKILLMAPLLALGGYNRYILLPRLGLAPRPRATLLRSVALESILVACVLLAAGVLATNAPPGVAVQASEPDQFTQEQFLQTAHLVFHISPNPPRVGIQNFSVSLHSFNQKPNPNGTEVYLQFRAPGAAQPDAVQTMKRASVDDWFLRGAYLTERGNWTVTITVQRPDEFKKVDFVVPVQ
jgi:copper transport protein